MKYFIGIDLGTSATKTILISQSGKVLASDSYKYSIYQPENGWAEQDPEDWKRAVLVTLKNVVEKAKISNDNVIGIGLSGQMHGLVMLDENGAPLRRSIIWCDQRSGNQEKEMQALMPKERWLEITANPPIAAWTAAKILWVRENEPELFARCRKILLPKDYIRYVLTGKFATDVSDASGMQLMDIKRRCWSEEILKLLQIDANLLCTLYESQEMTGTLRSEIARECGLKKSVIVAAGASDNAAAAVGTGVVNPGEAFTTIGTSAIVYTHLDQYLKIPNGSLHVCCCAVPGCWHTMGGPQSAGLSLQWFKDNFCADYVWEALCQEKNIYQFIDEKVKDIPIGSDKLIYLPFLMGERTPNMNYDCRGVFFGLNAIHTKAHMLRAIMEGVSYCLADCIDITRTAGVEIRSMRICGGGGKSPVWRKIMAEIYLNVMLRHYTMKKVLRLELQF